MWVQVSAQGQFEAARRAHGYHEVLSDEKMRDTRLNNTDELKATYQSTQAVPQADRLHATPH